MQSTVRTEGSDGSLHLTDKASCRNAMSKNSSPCFLYRDRSTTENWEGSAGLPGYRAEVMALVDNDVNGRGGSALTIRGFRTVTYVIEKP